MFSRLEAFIIRWRFNFYFSIPLLPSLTFLVALAAATIGTKLAVAAGAPSLLAGLGESRREEVALATAFFHLEAAAEAGFEDAVVLFESLSIDLAALEERLDLVFPVVDVAEAAEGGGADSGALSPFSVVFSVMASWTDGPSAVWIDSPLSLTESSLLSPSFS